MKTNDEKIIERLAHANNIREIQKTDPAIEKDNYSRGFYNGIELILSVMEDRDPEYKEPAPKVIEPKR